MVIPIRIILAGVVGFTVVQLMLMTKISTLEKALEQSRQEVQAVRSRVELLEYEFKFTQVD